MTNPKKAAETVGLIRRIGRLIPSKSGGGGRSGRARKNRAANKAALSAKDAAGGIGSPIAVAAARQVRTADEKAAAARKTKREAASNRRRRRATQRDKAQNLQRQGDRATTALKAGTATTVAGAGAGAALAARDGERKVDRRGRPLKSKANGSRTTTTTTTTKRDPNTTRPSGKAATAASAAPEIRSTKNKTTKREPKLGPEERAKKEAIYGAPQKDYTVGVSRGGVPFAEAFKHYKGKGQKTFTWNDKKYTTEVKGGGKTGTGKTGTGTTGTGKTGNGKTSTKETSATEKSAARKAIDRIRRRRTRIRGRAGGGMMAKKGYAKGGMTKKGYAKGGMTKKGYAKGGPVRGKPRGVGAALRGYGKALK